MTLWRYVARRLILLVPVMLGLTLITFTITHVFTDPVSSYVSVRTTPQQLQQIRQAYGLDNPLPIQYYYYLVHLIAGDWGVSRSQAGQPVLAVIANLFPATAELAVASILIQVAVGIPLGIVSAVRKDKGVDHVTRFFALSGVSMPVFWLGFLMQLLFSYQFRLWGLPSLPTTGRVDQLVLQAHPLQTITGLYLVDSLVTLNFPVFLSALSSVILPALTLAFTGIGLVTRITRSSMLEVLRQDYIILARAKGLPQRVVIYKHALKNAIIPTLTIVGIIVGYTLAGAPLVETVFAWPGIGRWAALAIVSDDVAGIMGFTILVGVVFVITNLIVDVAYAYLNPRVRLG
ncbi:MAG: ABC transporter permease [Thaumarchaeota archaeon]|nr:MAG: ABC transporter permease [Nitrososphaerota archaeon]